MEGDCNVYAHSSLCMRPTRPDRYNMRMVYILCGRNIFSFLDNLHFKFCQLWAFSHSLSSFSCGAGDYSSSNILGMCPRKHTWPWPCLIILMRGWSKSLKVDMPIFHFYLVDLDLWNAFCEVSPWGSFLFTLQRQKKECTPGDETIMKIHKKLFSGIPFNFTFFAISPKYKEFEVESFYLQIEKYGLSFDIKKCTTSGWALGDGNVIGIRSFDM